MPSSPQEPSPPPSLERFLQHQLPVWVSRRYGSAPHPGPACKQPRTHAYAVIILLTRGQSRVKHAGDQVLRAGDVHLIPPGDPHGPAHFQDAEGWTLAFHPEAFPSEEGWGHERGLKLGPLLRVRSGCHPVLKPSTAQRRRLERWLRLIEQELLQGERGHEEAGAALLRLILVELERIATPAAVPEPPGLSLVRQALTYIEANCLQPLSLASVARALHRTSPHVASTVRRETGSTVGEWILEYRMAEARRRLRGTDERVDIIAERVGYADVTHFIRLFRRLHGITPAAWRRNATTGYTLPP
ncbi:AraC family transcriptional regulator [Stigmatella sp. ncwal1]|uniref:AraC family transcriptional regulator n=1 Tax=Stigmatella ashevillensis TaxID=2995309 RepID=A0ABT5DIJ7_9BACT|nr:AraC family transcriptional regulator [Stigmatella ashevillena]MDC0712914.1 AraC family transcriptional regulator [Stigmatella ashevillena]